MTNQDDIKPKKKNNKRKSLLFLIAALLLSIVLCCGISLLFAPGVYKGIENLPRFAFEENEIPNNYSYTDAKTQNVVVICEGAEIIQTLTLDKPSFEIEQGEVNTLHFKISECSSLENAEAYYYSSIEMVEFQAQLGNKGFFSDERNFNEISFDATQYMETIDITEESGIFRITAIILDGNYVVRISTETSIISEQSVEELLVLYDFKDSESQKYISLALYKYIENK